MVVGTPGNFHFFKTRSEEQFDYDVMQLGAGFDLIWFDVLWFQTSPVVQLSS